MDWVWQPYPHVAWRPFFSAIGTECSRRSSTVSDAWWNLNMKYCTISVRAQNLCVVKLGRLCRDFRRNAQALQKVLEVIDPHSSGPVTSRFLALSWRRYGFMMLLVPQVTAAGGSSTLASLTWPLRFKSSMTDGREGSWMLKASLHCTILCGRKPSLEHSCRRRCNGQTQKLQQLRQNSSPGERLGQHPRKGRGHHTRSSCMVGHDCVGMYQNSNLTCKSHLTYRS